MSELDNSTVFRCPKNMMGISLELVPPEDRYLQSFCFSPDGRLMATVGGDPVRGVTDGKGNVTIWDLGSMTLLRKFAGHNGAVHACKFIQGGECLVTASGDYIPQDQGDKELDNTIRMWDVRTGRPIMIFEDHREPIRHLAVAPSERYILSGGGDYARGAADFQIRLWDLKSGKAVRRFDGHHAVISGLQFTSNGKSAFSASVDGVLLRWDLSNGKSKPMDANMKQIHCIALSKCGRFLAVSNDDCCCILDPLSGKELRKFPPKQTDGHFRARSVSFSDDSSKLTVACQNGAVVYSIATKRKEPEFVVELRYGWGPATHAELTPNGDVLAVSSWKSAFWCPLADIEYGTSRGLEPGEMSAWDAYEQTAKTRDRTISRNLCDGCGQNPSHARHEIRWIEKSYGSRRIGGGMSKTTETTIHNFIHLCRRCSDKGRTAGWIYVVSVTLAAMLSLFFVGSVPWVFASGSGIVAVLALRTRKRFGGEVASMGNTSKKGGWVF